MRRILLALWVVCSPVLAQLVRPTGDTPPRAADSRDSRAGLALPQDSDVFITGYITAAIECQLEIPRDKFRVVVTRGRVTVYVKPDQEDRMADVTELLAGIEGVAGATVEPWKEDRPELDRQGATIRTRPETFLPRARPVFTPLLADPKEPSFYASWRKYDLENRPSVDIADVGLGGSIPVWRNHPDRANQLGFSVAGGVFSQFDMDSNADLFNTDYVVGFPFEWRHGGASARLRLYHQSSHLGDEFLINTRTPRVNLSFEAVELLLSYELWGLRVYGGGEYLVRKKPEELERGIWHWGAEYRGRNKLLDAFRLGAGWDVKHFEDHNFAPDRSLKAGFIFGDYSNEIEVMLEYFEGYSPHGQQFFAEKIEYLGLGVYYRF